jgi:hypothetical protein
MDGGTSLGSGTLNASGQTTLPTASLLVGTHSITAVYGGGAGFAGSTSTVLTQTVNQAGTSTSVSSSRNPSVSGQTVTFTALVSPSTATGAVQFFTNGPTLLGTVSLSGGKASLSTSALGIGSYSITASYGGDKNYTGSNSATLTQTVNPTPATTSTAITSSVNPSAYRGSVTFTATVTSAAGIPTGTVKLLDGGTTLGTQALSGSSQATFTTSGLSAGSHSITAVYGGGGGFAGSTSPVLTQTVKRRHD